jgi:phospholipid-transporting ATPase
MKRTGIKVWVLTGDKVGTAINIGLSAGLLENEKSMNQYLLDGKEKSLEEQLDYAKRMTDEIADSEASGISSKKQAIIVAGDCLTRIIADAQMLEKFCSASDHVDVVLACRVSPQQKADVVMTIRNRFPSKVTLAIGDGANDVSMILSAHVGVGILGREGQQAARSADFAIGQFKFLKSLMFVHGRECNRRNSMLVLYIFYKNVLYILCQYIFGFWSLFSGQTLYEAIMYQNYNITVTSLPIMFFCLFDFEYLKGTEIAFKDQNGVQVPVMDTDPEQLYLMKNPKLFEASMKGEYFTIPKFIQYLLYSLFHAAMIYFLGLQFVANPDMQADGKNLGLWVPGHIVFGACIIVCNLVLLLRYNNWTFWGEILVYLMILNYFTLMLLESVVGLGMIPQLYYVFDVMFSCDLVWVQLAACAAITLALELAASHISRLSYDAEKPIREESLQHAALLAEESAKKK